MNTSTDTASLMVAPFRHGFGLLPHMTGPLDTPRRGDSAAHTLSVNASILRVRHVWLEQCGGLASPLPKQLAIMSTSPAIGDYRAE